MSAVAAAVRRKYPAAISQADAAGILLHGTWGYNTAQINSLTAQGRYAYEAWIDNQLTAPAYDWIGARTLYETDEGAVVTGPGDQVSAIMGGYDTHSAPFVSVNTALLQQLNDALTAFQAEMVAQSMTNNVTLFTASDFGRALLPNSGGTDHGWGGHHFVIGGAVNGGRLYNRDVKAGPILNTYPTITLGGPWDGGEGRLIPGISVSEFGATVMKWMGVPDAVSNGVNPMELLFPLLPNFPSRDLGIMA